MIRTGLRNMLLAIFMFVLPLAVCQAPAPALRAGSVVTVTVHSQGLEGNKLGDSADRTVTIYLPPSYASSPQRRFATLYLLHGYTRDPAVWTTEIFPGSSLSQALDGLMAAGKSREMIVVMPDSRNKYLGSMYSNSVVTGNWEDFIVRDVVSYVDSHYRTLAKRESRGIAGHSMGGYGALMLGMKHADIFSAVYALSPCCDAMKADLTSSNPAWHAAIAANASGKFFSSPHGPDEFFTDAFTASGAAWSPNPSRPMFADLPYREEGGRLVENPETMKLWQEHMPLYAVVRYRDNLMHLRGLYIDYGLQDQFSHIPVGIRAISDELTQLGVPHVLASYTGDHGNHVRDRLEMAVMPFFSEMLEEK